MSSKNINIIPAIMPKTREELEKYTARFAGLVEMLQIDVMDGVFVPEISYPYVGKRGLDKVFAESGARFPARGVSYELDLMIARPEKDMEMWIKRGVKRVIFHIESIGDTKKFWDGLVCAKIHKNDADYGDMEIGLAINIETPNEKLYPYIEKIDFVQCMGISRIGFQGEPFDERVLPKIERLRKRFPELIISIDGGVSLETAPLLIRAGANRLVSGSALLKSDNVEETVEAFRKLMR